MFRKMSLIVVVVILTALSWFYWVGTRDEIEVVNPGEQQFTREFQERKAWPLERHEQYWQSQQGEVQFYVLGELVHKAHQAKDWDRAASYATKYLAQAEQFPESWNFGNAIFHAHMALSEIAWSKGDRAEASEHLLKASGTPGSPQLSSFGPFKEEFHRTYLRQLVSEENREHLLEFARNFKKVVAHRPGLSNNDEEERRSIQVANGLIVELDQFIAALEANELPEILTSKH